MAPNRTPPPYSALSAPAQAGAALFGQAPSSQYPQYPQYSQSPQSPQSSMDKEPPMSQPASAALTASAALAAYASLMAAGGDPNMKIPGLSPDTPAPEES